MPDCLARAALSWDAPTYCRAALKIGDSADDSLCLHLHFKPLAPGSPIRASLPWRVFQGRRLGWEHGPNSASRASPNRYCEIERASGRGLQKDESRFFSTPNRLIFLLFRPQRALISYFFSIFPYFSRFLSIFLDFSFSIS